MARQQLIASGEVVVDAAADDVFALVSDPVAMVPFVAETVGARWLGRATGAAVGARFRGINRNGWHRWPTTCRVTDVAAGRRFAFEVSTPFKVPISRWQYDVEPTAEGCRLVERTWIRVPRWFVPFAIAITGEPDRARVNNDNIATTLERIRQHFDTRARTIAA